jgi:MFS family permease
MINSIESFIVGMIFVSLLYPQRKRIRGRLQRFASFLKSNLIAFAFIVIAFMAGLIIASLIYRWNLVADSFYSVRLIEIVQIAATLLIAIFITYFIQSKLSHNIKKREIISELFSMFERNTTELHDMACLFLQETDEKYKYRITANFKKLGILLSIIKKTKKPKDDILIDSKSLLKAYFGFKEAITDKPFSKFSETDRDKLGAAVSSAYQDLLLKVYKCRFDLYSS